MKLALRNIKAGQFVVPGTEVYRRGESRWAVYRLTGGNAIRLHGSRTYPVFDDLAEAQKLADENRRIAEQIEAERQAKAHARTQHRAELFKNAGGWLAAEKWANENPTALGNCIPGSEGYRKRMYSRFCDALEAH